MCLWETRASLTMVVVLDLPKTWSMEWSEFYIFPSPIWASTLCTQEADDLIMSFVIRAVSSLLPIPVAGKCGKDWWCLWLNYQTLLFLMNRNASVVIEARQVAMKIFEDYTQSWYWILMWVHQSVTFTLPALVEISQNREWLRSVPKGHVFKKKFKQSFNNLFIHHLHSLER